MKLFCSHCDEEVFPSIREMGGESKHYAKAECPNCGRWLRWVPKPKNEGKRGKTSKYSPTDLNVTQCEICGRSENILGSYEVFEIHHKVPIEEEGQDVPQNLLVLCTACHRLCHYQRTYLNQHLSQIYELYDLIKTHFQKDSKDYDELILKVTELLGI